VVVVDADAGLFAADFRAPERLFATLMQVAGRAGRHRSAGAVTLVQTRYPEHPLFASLAAHDYPGFAARELAAREAAGFPPFAYQALLLAQARRIDTALAFLQKVREHLLSQSDAQFLTVCDPVPMPLARLKDVSRAQLLVESPARRPLHRLLGALGERLDTIAGEVTGTIRWQLVIDPIEI
jgi:primosomal protein N' (replication factor Y)